MQVAVEIGNSELVAVRVEGDLGDLGGGGELLVLLVGRESVT